MKGIRLLPGDNTFRQVVCRAGDALDASPVSLLAFLSFSPYVLKCCLDRFRSVGIVGLVGQFIEESAWISRTRLAPFKTALRERKGKFVLSSRDSDVAQATFFIDAVEFFGD